MKRNAKSVDQLELGGVASVVSLRVEKAQDDERRARDEDKHDRLMDVLAKICAAHQSKNVAVEVDAQPSHFSEAMGPTRSRPAQLRWLPTFARMCPLELRDELRDAIDGLFDQEDALTADEEDAARDAALAECGRAGQIALEAQRARLRAARRRSR